MDRNIISLQRSLNVIDNMWAAFTDINSSSSSSVKQDAPAQQELPINAFTSGEIIFVTILVSIIAIAVGLAIQSILKRRREKLRESETVAANQEISVATVEMGTDDNYANNPGIGGPSRRISIDSTQSGHSIRSERVYTKSGSNGGYSRKDSSTSLASRVSTDYKFAAIDHMNQIAQRGRHDG